jgi:hypothetical protein
MPDIERWEELYEETVLEVDNKQMPGRIAKTREASAGRLEDLEHDSDHHSERHRMQDVLDLLKSLESHAKK